MNFGLVFKGEVVKKDKIDSVKAYLTTELQRAFKKSG
jgi:hypothetical protein